jgi:hypothetical protein
MLLMAGLKQGFHEVRGESMDCYIVRIYRRNKKVPEHIVGTIEFVKQQEVRSFKTLWELTEILSPADSDTKREQQPANRPERVGRD